METFKIGFYDDYPPKDGKEYELYTDLGIFRFVYTSKISDELDYFLFFHCIQTYNTDTAKEKAKIAEVYSQVCKLAKVIRCHFCYDEKTYQRVTSEYKLDRVLLTVPQMQIDENRRFAIFNFLKTLKPIYADLKRVNKPEVILNISVPENEMVKLEAKMISLSTQLHRISTELEEVTSRFSSLKALTVAQTGTAFSQQQ